MWRLCGILMVLTIWQAHHVDGQEMFSTHPSKLIKGRAFNVNVALTMAAKETITYNVALQSMERDLYEGSNKDVVIYAGRQTVDAEFMIPEEGISSSSANVVVKQAGRTVLTSSIGIVRDSSSTSVIQTDRGKYKPGDEVKFRVLNIDSKTLPLTTEITAIVTDPQDTKVAKKTSNAADKKIGIIDGSFKLIDDAILGTYKIKVSGKSEQEATFEVEKYVLPKFEAELTLDEDTQGNGHNPTTISIIGGIKAVYTHGEFVRGMMVLNIDGIEKLRIRDFDGNYRFNVELPAEDYPLKGSSRVLQVQAVVTEQITDIPANDTKPFTVYSAPFTVQPVEPLPYFSQQDEEYTLQVRIVDVAGGALKPAWQISPTNSPYRLYYSYYDGGLVTKNIVVTSNPMTVTFQINKGVQLNNLKVWLNHTMERSQISSGVVDVKVRTMSSYSTKYISVIFTGTKQDLNQQDEACFMIEPFVSGDQAFYQVAGNLGAHSLLKYTQQAGHCFRLTDEFSPKFEIVAYKLQTYTSGNSEMTEVLVNKYVGTYSPQTEPKVTMTLTPPVLKPGGTVVITFDNTRASGSSILGLRGIDKSSRLLAPAEDISVEKITNLRAMDRLFESGASKDSGNSDGIMPFGDVRMPFPYFDPTVSPGSLLSDAGLTLAKTKGLSFYKNDIWFEGFPEYDGRVFAAGAAPDMDNEAVADADDSMPTSAESGKKQEQTKVRKDFPETWLWGLQEISKGTTQIREKVPDSITNWVIDSFTLNPTDGLSIIDTQELTVTQDLFVSMNLPYSLIRGEQFKLQILVFNYKSTDVNVRIELMSSTDFRILDPSKRVAVIDIGSKSSGVLEVQIEATTIGDIMLKASVKDQQDSTNVDNVERSLLVQPEGREVRNSTQLVNEFPESSGTTQSFDVMDLVQVDDLVDGSLRVYVLMTGDVMGPYISGLGGLIRMPYGCGEQNMISMVPGLFVGMYLNSRNKLDMETRAKVEKAMISGISRELNYRHDDGSFSAFGKRDKKGSTWLTAYVLMVFAQIGSEGFADTLNPVKLYEAYMYLISMMKTDEFELFKEEGVVIHKDMKGGVNGKENGLSFSAFILICLQDYYVYLNGTNDVSKKAEVMAILEDVSQQLYGRSMDINLSAYSKALLAYAFARSGAMLSNPQYLERAESYLMDLNSDPSRRKRDIYMKPKSTDIESSGYTLLAYVTLAEAVPSNRTMFFEQSRSIVEWLVDKRASDGTYSNTQDLSVALKALATDAIVFKEGSSIDFSVKVTPSSDRTIFNEDNYYIQVQEPVDLTALSDNTLKMELTGVYGKAYISVLAIFNRRQGSGLSPLDLTVEHRIIGKKPYISCGVKAVDGLENTLSSMVLVTLDMQSGYVIDDITADNDKSKCSRIEYTEDRKKMTCYYLNDDVNGFKERQLKVFYEQRFKVDGLKPSKVEAMDYYEQENNKVIMIETLTEEAIVDPDTPIIGASGLTVNILLLSITFLLLLLHRNVF